MQPQEVWGAVADSVAGIGRRLDRDLLRREAGSCESQASVTGQDPGAERSCGRGAVNRQ